MSPDPLDNLPPSPPVDPPIPRPTATEPLHCEFCQCRLTPHGHALELSAKAKRWRDHDDDIEKLNAKIAALETTNRDQARELHELKAAKKGIFD